VAGTRRASILKPAVTLVTLLAFAATIFAIRWVVTTQRSPGAITVIEAQAMDMTAMKAPPGVQPVATEKPVIKPIAGQQSFPATVMAFSDEEIVARVPGKVVSLAYPGDHVSAGQVVAKLDADEYLAQERQSRYQSDSSKATALSSTQQTEVLQATKSRSEADLDVARIAVTKAQADKLMAEQDLQKFQEEAEAKRAEAKARQADLTYAEANLARQQSLYQQGFASADQYDIARRMRDRAKADLEQTQSEVNAKDKASQAASARVSAMGQAVEEAKAQTKSAQIAVSEANRQVDKARSDARATAAQAQATSSQFDSAATIAGYTQLRSLDNCMVAERFVSPGAVVTAGEKLLMLHNADKVRIQAQLPETLAASVVQGTPAVIHYGTIDRSATITSIFPTADTTTRTFMVEALIDNPQHRYLPGSFASMSVETQGAQEQLAVRSSAIQMDSSGNPFVWVLKDVGGQKTDWTCPMHTEVSEPGPGKCPICKMDLVPRSRGGKTVASRRNVKVGPTDGDQVAITEGLKPQDEVIWAGLDGLIEGSPVASVPWGTDGPQQLPSVSGASEPTAPTPGNGAELAPKGRPEHSRGRSPRVGAPTPVAPDGARRSPIPPTPAKQETKPAAKSHKQLWTCPMHPEVVQDHPGKCPKCGMDLVPKTAAR